MKINPNKVGTNLDLEPVEVEVNTPPPKGDSLTSANPILKKKTGLKPIMILYPEILECTQMLILL